MRARRRPVVTGREQMIDSVGPVVEWRGGEGRVRVRGELWQARSATPLRPGQQVRVKRIDGLTLEVEPDERRRRLIDGSLIFGQVWIVAAVLLLFLLAIGAARLSRVRARRHLPPRPLLEGEGAGADPGHPGDPAGGARSICARASSTCRSRT